MQSKAKQGKATQRKAKQRKAKQSNAKQSKAKQRKAEQSTAKQSKAQQSKRSEAKQSKAEQSKAIPIQISMISASHDIMYLYTTYIKRCSLQRKRSSNSSETCAERTERHIWAIKQTDIARTLCGVGVGGLSVAALFSGSASLPL